MDGATIDAKRARNSIGALKRSVDFDVLSCPRCKGRMEIIAVITRPEAIERILSHLSLPLEMQPLGMHGTMGCDVSDEQIPEFEWSQSGVIKLSAVRRVKLSG